MWQDCSRFSCPSSQSCNTQPCCNCSLKHLNKGSHVHCVARVIERKWHHFEWSRLYGSELARRLSTETRSTEFSVGTVGREQIFKTDLFLLFFFALSIWYYLEWLNQTRIRWLLWRTAGQLYLALLFVQSRWGRGRAQTKTEPEVNFNWREWRLSLTPRRWRFSGGTLSGKRIEAKRS